MPPEPPPQSRSSEQHGHVVLPSSEDWESASALFSNYVAKPSPSVLPPPILSPALLGPPQQLQPRGPDKCALAGDGPGWGHEQAAMAAVASGPSGAGAAKEPVKDVPLSQKCKRVRTEDSEARWASMAFALRHDKRQKVESSAVAGKESSAVADNGRAPRLQINYVTDPPPSSTCTRHMISASTAGCSGVGYAGHIVWISLACRTLWCLVKISPRVQGAKSWRV